MISVTPLRCAGLGAVALFAAVALFSGLDRISESQPGAAEFVPGMFRTAAARALAPQNAAEVERAVRNDPIDARSVALLGALRLRDGRSADARAAFAVSGQMGWREPTTQLYWMVAALQAGDVKIAAQRLDALLRQAPRLEQRAVLLDQFEQSAAGQAELVAKLAAQPAWARAYFEDAAEVPDASFQRRADIALRLAMQAGVRDCALVSPLVEELARRNAAALAQTIRAAHCGGHPPTFRSLR